MVFSKEWNDCIKCNKRVFSDESNIYCNNIYCEKCLNIIKKTEPTYKINIIIFDGTNIDINIKPKKATFESIKLSFDLIFSLLLVNKQFKNGLHVVLLFDDIVQCLFVNQI